MLLAGAREVFYIRADDQTLGVAFLKFLESLGKDRLIIAESISLRYFVRPAVFILLKFNYPHEIKNSYLELEHLADRVLLSDNERIVSGFPVLRVENALHPLLKL